MGMIYARNILSNYNTGNISDLVLRGLNATCRLGCDERVLYTGPALLKYAQVHEYAAPRDILQSGARKLIYWE